MKILLVEGAPEFGGQARHVYDLARGLTNRDHQVAVACAREEAVLRLERSGIPCCKLPFRTILDVGTLASLASLIRNERFDIVHSHGVRAGLVARAAARLIGGCSVVHTVHSLAEDLAPGAGLAGAAAKRVYRSADALLGKGADRVVTVSEDLRRRTVRRAVPASKVVTIHSGVDLSQFDESVSCESGRHSLGLPLGCKVVGTVARFTKQKALADLIAAARIVCAEREDVCFTLIGDGPEYVHLRQVVQEFGLGHRVFLPGYTRATAKVLPGFDVFALSSHWEGHPLSVLEAMASGLPVVATRVAGIAETVVHGETGYVVPVGDPASMADTLLSVLSSSDAGARMGRAGRQRVISLFSLEKMLRDIESVYLDLCRSRKIGEPVGAVR